MVAGPRQARSRQDIRNHACMPEICNGMLLLPASGQE